MASAFFADNEHVSEHAVVSQISLSLSCDTFRFSNRTKFTSGILTDRVRNKGEQRCRYKFFQWDIKGPFDIFNGISDHVTFFN